MKDLYEAIRQGIRIYMVEYSKLQNPMFRYCENMRLYSACRTLARGLPWEDCA